MASAVLLVLLASDTFALFFGLGFIIGVVKHTDFLSDELQEHQSMLWAVVYYVQIHIVSPIVL